MATILATATLPRISATAAMYPGNPNAAEPGPKEHALSVWQVVLIYAVFASLWIFFSDKTLLLLIGDPQTITRVSMVKGWLFVAVTSILLFGLIRRMVQSLQRANQAVQQREHSLREAQLIAGVGSYALDLASGRWESSEACDKVLGIDTGYDRSVAGWVRLVHPDERASMAAYFRDDVVGRQQAFDRQYRIIRPVDGAERWVHGLGQLTFDEQGRPVTMRGTIQDISAKKQADMEVAAARNALQATLDALPDLLFEVDQQGIIHNYHTHRGDLLAAPPAMFLGKSFAEVLPPDVAELCVQAIDEATSRGHSTGLVYSLALPQGRHWFELSVAPMAGSATPNKHFIFIARDITERQVANEKLQLAARVFSHVHEGICITGADGTILDVNEAFTRITGFAPDEAIGQNPRIMKSGLQGHDFYTAMWRKLNEQGYWSGELWNRHQNGELYAVMTTISAVRDARGQAQQFVGLFSDVTASKKHQAQLEHIAHFDALTDLPNRVLLADRLRQAMVHAQRQGQKLAVAYLDLDGFKTVNDRHGHDVGDQLLVALAKAMKEALREGDTLARIGGDEFVAVLIDQADDSSCIPIMGRLLAAAASSVALGELALQVSASVGLTFYPQDQGMDADQLLRQADLAMYQAKVAGKNQYQIFDAEQDSSIRGHHESLERIRLALAQDEFVLHYQPKVNMRTGQMVGVEALIRWQHPDNGLLAPAAFLPVIENHQLAVAVGEWVIDTALGQIERWREAGLNLAVSVNVGALQLQQGNFVGRLTTLLAAHPAVDPSMLQIEVLETSALADMVQASQVIEDCAQMGVMFALDDFGTGYSSLTYLKRLRVSLLKIDQSFVRDMLEDPDDLAILEGVIGLAAAFKREVIAEGVETVAHGTALMHLGCELAQGYGIARPMPADQVPAWALAWRPDPAWA